MIVEGVEGDSRAPRVFAGCSLGRQGDHRPVLGDRVPRPMALVRGAISIFSLVGLDGPTGSSGWPSLVLRSWSPRLADQGRWISGEEVIHRLVLRSAEVWLKLDTPRTVVGGEPWRLN